MSNIQNHRWWGGTGVIPVYSDLWMSYQPEYTKSTQSLPTTWTVPGPGTGSTTLETRAAQDNNTRNTFLIINAIWDSSVIYSVEIISTIDGTHFAVRDSLPVSSWGPVQKAGLFNLSYLNGVFISVVNNQLYTLTPTGATWTNSVLPFTRITNSYIGSVVASDHNKWPLTTVSAGPNFAVMSFTGTTARSATCYTSNNLSTWTTSAMPTMAAPTAPYFAQNRYLGIISCNDKLFAITQRTSFEPSPVNNIYVMSSDYGVTWNTYSVPWFSAYSSIVGGYVYRSPTNIVYRSGVYLAYIQSGFYNDGEGTLGTDTYWTSTNGTTWTARTYPAGNKITEGTYIFSTPFGEVVPTSAGGFINFGKTIRSSSDGISWGSTSVIPPSGRIIHGKTIIN